MTRRILLMLFFWATAALIVASAQPLAPRVAAILFCSFGYMKIDERSTLQHAFLIGAAWFFLNIVTDVATSQALDLTGSASAPMVRGTMFLVWLMSPAVFARNEG